MTDTQQQPWTYPMPTPPAADEPTSGTAWYRRHWVQLVAVGVVGLGIGGASAGSGDNLKTDLAAATTRATTAEAKVSAAEGRAAAAEQQAKTAQSTADASVAPKVAAVMAPQKAALDKERARLGQVREELGALRSTLTAQKSALDAREAKVSGMEAEAAANEIAGDGVYRVGADIKPGIYKATPADSGNCYYARLSNLDGDIIDNNNVSGSVTIIVKSSDVALELNGCNTFHKVG